MIIYTQGLILFNFDVIHGNFGFSLQAFEETTCNFLVIVLLQIFIMQKYPNSFLSFYLDM
jgi:hypothetical protein